MRQKLQLYGCDIQYMSWFNPLMPTVAMGTAIKQTKLSSHL